MANEEQMSTEDVSKDAVASNLLIEPKPTRGWLKALVVTIVVAISIVTVAPVVIFFNELRGLPDGISLNERFGDMERISKGFGHEDVGELKLSYTNRFKDGQDSPKDDSAAPRMEFSAEGEEAFRLIGANIRNSEGIACEDTASKLLCTYPERGYSVELSDLKEDGAVLAITDTLSRSERRALSTRESQERETAGVARLAPEYEVMESIIDSMDYESAGKVVEITKKSYDPAEMTVTYSNTDPYEVLKERMLSQSDPRGKKPHGTAPQCRVRDVESSVKNVDSFELVECWYGDTAAYVSQDTSNKKTQLRLTSMPHR